MAVHPTAVVEEGASLGDSVEIGPFCVVGSGVVLADGVRLLSHVSVRGRTEIGSGTMIYPGAVLGGEAQIRGPLFKDARLVVGAECTIRECVTMSTGSEKGRGTTTVGNCGYFMAYSHVGHDCVVGDNVTFANGATLGGHVRVGEGVILGGLSAVQQFGRVGRGAMIGGITGVNRDVIPYGIAYGDHVQLAGLNLIGLKRRGLSRETIHAMRAAYREIFTNTNGTLAERAQAARNRWHGIAEIEEIADFIKDEAHQQLCTPGRRDRAAESS
ncbi:MAG: acyl-ACP--UDP-N-acetylglucosamine O-acyltransferase [Alphaproteobacteria bacterium]|nr:acyl-ACP--UDP-N-acetylglucosamine O-acyltransferase [Alphaproteobacteria bacterium]